MIEKLKKSRIRLAEMKINLYLCTRFKVGSVAQMD